MAATFADFDTGHTGFIHDAQLDPFGQCLATASADGHIRLWDVRKPEAPAFLTDLSAHCAAVYQVAWAPPATGVLLASASSDGTLAVWGRRASAPDAWHVVRQESLEQHGAVRAVAWAPGEHGAVIACVCDDGTLVTLRHLGAVPAGDGVVEQRWQAVSHRAHTGQANAVAWATPPELSDRALGMKGARLATAGDDGVRVWSWNEAVGSWEPEPVDQAPPPAAAEAAGPGGDAPLAALAAPAAPLALGAAPVAAAPRAAAAAGVRALDWRPWDGEAEMLASASGREVFIWAQGAGGPAAQWRAQQRIDFEEDVWSVSWADVGDILLVSLGLEGQRVALVKRRLDGEWDVMDIQEASH